MILFFPDNYEAQCALTVCFFVGNALVIFILSFVVAIPSGRIVLQCLEDSSTKNVYEVPTGKVQALGASAKLTGDHRQRIKSLRGKMVVFNREVRNSGKHVSYEEAPLQSRLSLQTLLRMPTAPLFHLCCLFSPFSPDSINHPSHAKRIFRIPKHSVVHAVCFLATFVEDGCISTCICVG